MTANATTWSPKLLVSANRERLLMRLDAWIYPGTADQRQALADAAAALGKAERVETVSRTLSRTAERGCGSPVALLLPADAAGADLNAPDGKVAPLARASAIVHVLEADGRSLRVHPNDKTSIFGLLPCDDRRWVAETDADVIVGVPGPGAELLGVLAAGRRFDGRIVRSVDLPFLDALGAAAGLAVGRLTRAEEAGALDEPPAQECPVCRCLTQTGESPTCGGRRIGFDIRPNDDAGGGLLTTGGTWPTSRRSSSQGRARTGPAALEH